MSKTAPYMLPPLDTMYCSTVEVTLRSCMSTGLISGFSYFN